MNYSDLFTIDDFCLLLETGFIDEGSGVGYYMADGQETFREVPFSVEQIRKDVAEYHYQAVAWYEIALSTK